MVVYIVQYINTETFVICFTTLISNWVVVGGIVQGSAHRRGPVMKRAAHSYRA